MKAQSAPVVSLVVLVTTLAGVVIWHQSPRAAVILPPAPEPDVRALSDSPVEAPGLVSDVSIDLDIDQGAVQAAIDAVVPRTLSGSEEDPLAAANNDRLTWSLSIGSAQLSSYQGALAFRIPLDHGLINITGRVGVARKSKGALGLLEKALGFDFNETVEFEGAIVGTVRPRFNKDWTIEPEFDMSVSLSKAEAEFFGRVLKVSVRRAIQSRIEAKMREQEQQLRARLASDGRVATVVERLWNAMHAVVQVSSQPTVWMSWEPLALLVSPFQASDDQVSITVGTRVRTAIVVSPVPPVLNLTPLPSPGTVKRGSEISMQVPVSMPLDQLTTVTSQSVALPQLLELDGGRVEVQSVTAHELADTFTVAVAVKVSPDWRPAVTTTMYVSGTPHLDRASSQLSLQHADFDEQTRQALSNMGGFMLTPEVLGAIEQRSVFQVLEPGQEIVARVSAELDLIEDALPDWARAELSINSGSLSGVAATDGWLVSVLDITGGARLQVGDIDALLADRAL